MRHLLWGLTLLAACGPLSGESPWLSIDPTAVYLPAIREGTIGQASVRLTNLGHDPLEIRALRLDKTHSHSLAVSQPRPIPFSISPDATVELQIHYQASLQPDEKWRLWIESDDPLRPQWSLSLHPLPAQAVLTATPPSVDFGPVASAKMATQRIQLRNLGLVSLTDLQLQWVEPCEDFTVSMSDRDIPPQDAVTLAVHYQPRGGNQDQGMLRISWTGGDLVIPVHGWQDLAPPE